MPKEFKSSITFSPTYLLKTVKNLLVFGAESEVFWF